MAVSFRGHGSSDKPSTGYSVNDLATDVEELLEVCGIEKAVIAGHSGSCLVARRVALDVPERTVGLVLEGSPVTLRGNVRLAEFVRSVVMRLEDPIDPGFARSFLADTSSAALDAGLLDKLIDDLLEVPTHVWRELFASLLDYDDVAELERISVSTLLIWGDADSLVTREVQDELARLLVRSQLLVYAGIGHTPRWEDPGRFVADVAAFIEHLPGLGASR
jgi:pimeloyl-ACP methyl ester carboxylesterase